MTSFQDRFQMKKETMDKWSVRELLCLASAVSRSGDQNWISVSRAVKPFGEPNRPSDWFHQRNCAAQYAMLLGNMDTPKRKKRVSNVDASDSPTESLFQRLVTERLTELKKFLAEEKAEYRKLQEDMTLLQLGKVSEEQLDIWCKEIEEEEYQKEQESIAQAQCFKEREQRKQEVDNVWRPVRPTSIAGQKRKNSDALDSLIDSEHVEEMQHQHLPPPYPQTPEPSKPALSPLLTSLLKSPSHVQNSSMLHSSMTNRHVPNMNTNPMIASLLNSSTGVTVSPGLQHLVSTAIGQESNNVIEVKQQQQPIRNDILDDENLPNIKIDDLANSILVQDGPLPEIKKEEVDDIISEIIENAHDIVNDPEQHLQLDGNGDININMELDDFEEEELQKAEKEQQQEEENFVREEPQQEQKIVENSVENLAPLVQQTVPTTSAQTQQSLPQPPVVDPFEFQEDPVIHLDQSIKVSNINKQESRQYVPHYQLQQPSSQVASIGAVDVSEKNDDVKSVVEITENDITRIEDEKCEISIESPKPLVEVKEDDIGREEVVEEKRELNESVTETTDEVSEKSPDVPLEVPKLEQTPIPGSVEIVEVISGDDEEMNKELDKSQILDIVHSIKLNESEDPAPKIEPEKEKIKSETEESSPTESKETIPVATFEESSEASDLNVDMKKELIIEDVIETSVVTSNFPNDLYDDANMEVKIDKSGRAKRDYSRTKKKEEKGFDILLAIEKAQMEDSELTEENFSDNNTDTEKKDLTMKFKTETERSNSPWTEEEENSKGGKRRYSTPGTPIDSVPNSPASSLTFNYEDDREYRNWKKSVMLVYNRLATNKYASLFLKPITDDQAPGYSSTVYRPMDLQTIKKNIENGSIRTTLEFKRDTMLMFTNAIMYNRTDETIYKMALQMQQESLEPIEILMAAQSQENVPLRRETRTSESCTKRKRTITEEALVKSAKKRKED